MGSTQSRCILNIFPGFILITACVSTQLANFFCFNRIRLEGFDVLPNLFSVAAASQLHRKLMYTNEHQKCLLESQKRELESKKFELVTLKAIVAQKKDSSVRNVEEERSRSDALQRELQMVC